MSERDTQRLILDWLAAKGILAFRMNSGMTISSYKGRTRAIRYGTPGMADVLATPVHRKLLIPLLTWIEVKGEKGKQSEEQKSFQKLVESHGHSYVLARSLEDVEKVLG